ncbi:MAG: signal peptidase I [Fimbriimonadaceae bacterium]|nr:signal peptidase I [Fimbriimonadaceae bacterium]
MLEFLAQTGQNGAAVDLVDRLARTPLSQIVILVAVCTLVRAAVFPVLKNTAAHKRVGLYKLARFGNELADAIVYAGVFVFLLIRPFGIQTFKIPSGSMLDTLQLQDYIIANKAIYRYTDPVRGDIVVFKPPERALYENQKGQDIDFIKRCIGLPGDVIEVRNDVLYRNGQPVAEPYVVYKETFEANSVSHKDPSGLAYRASRNFKLVKRGDDFVPVQWIGRSVNEDGMIAPEYVAKSQAEKDELMALPAAPVPAGHYLFMGDNRDWSSDGRYWGLARREDVIGRSEAVWWPIARWRGTR